MIITLDRLWLTPVIDPTQARAFELNDPLSHKPITGTETRRGAGGNFYAVTVPGIQQSATNTLVNCTDADVAWLKAWLTLPMCYRDPRGLKFYGFYDSDGFNPRTLPDSWSVTLTVVETSFSEDVTA